MSGTTHIEKISLDEVLAHLDTLQIDDDDLPKTIMDMSLDIETRIMALERLYKLKGEDALEIFSRLSSMYSFSGIKLIEEFLKSLCMCESLASILRLNACDSLFQFEDHFDSDDDDDFISHVHTKNERRQANAFDMLDKICNQCPDLPTPCRIKSIFTLMQSDEFRANANDYFQELASTDTIEIAFRYKTIVSVENQPIREPMFFAYYAMTNILDRESNDIYYRILAASYLLRKSNDYTTEEERYDIQQILLSFANDSNIPYDRRADCADILLGIGDEHHKKLSAYIIEKLGGLKDGTEYVKPRTLFEHAQNVHTDGITESTNEILEHLSAVPLKRVNDRNIDFLYVRKAILEFLETESRTHFQTNEVGTDSVTCAYSDTDINKADAIKEDGKYYLNGECMALAQRDKNVQFALNRIEVDQAIYSKFSHKLYDILLRVYTYISGHEFENEMMKRLVQELNDMAITCSSGFAYRLLNTTSGFGDFSIKITYREQISGNLLGRMNARARAIADTNSLFSHHKRMEDIVGIYLNKHQELKQELCEELRTNDINPTKDLVVKHLMSSRQNVQEEVLEWFQEQVLNDLTDKTTDVRGRTCFQYFLSVCIADIREELWAEYRLLIDDPSFDLYFRAALSSYEDVGFA